MMPTVFDPSCNKRSHRENSLFEDYIPEMYVGG